MKKSRLKPSTINQQLAISHFCMFESSLSTASQPLCSVPPGPLQGVLQPLPVIGWVSPHPDSKSLEETILMF